jgi:CHAD domain-containing protein
MRKHRLPLLQESAVCRRVRKTLASVQARLGLPLAPADVHQLRRALKQLRSWCRLLESTGQPGIRQLKPTLGGLAAHYGSARDAQVRLETLEELEAHSGLRFPQTRARLQHEVPALAAAPEASTCRRSLDALEALNALLAGGFPAQAALQRGLHRSRKKAGDMCQRVWRSPDTDGLHELRKKVKILANQYALCVDRRGYAGRDCQRLDRLGRMLGRCHDLAVLRTALSTMAGTAAWRGELDRLEALITAEEQTLRPESRSLSEECFPGKVR